MAPRYQQVIQTTVRFIHAIFCALKIMEEDNYYMIYLLYLLISVQLDGKVINGMNLLVFRIVSVRIILEAFRSIHDGISPFTTHGESVSHNTPLRLVVKRHDLDLKKTAYVN